MRGDLAQLVVGQFAVFIAHAILRGANLEHNVATAFQVIRRESAFAGIHPAFALERAIGQRLHRRFGYGAIAHAGNID